MGNADPIWVEVDVPIIDDRLHEPGPGEFFLFRYVMHTPFQRDLNPRAVPLT